MENLFLFYLVIFIILLVQKRNLRQSFALLLIKLT